MRRQSHADDRAAKRATAAPADARARLVQALATPPDDRELQDLYADALIEQDRFPTVIQHDR
jgi:hypothetical protein